MVDHRRQLVFLAVLCCVLAYGGTYALLRGQRELVRTGRFHNLRTPSGELAPGGGWEQSGVQRPAGSAGGHWLEIVFWPVIRVESLFWDTAGRRLRQI